MWLDLTEFKEYARIDHAHEDAMLGRLLDAAEGYLEGEDGILGRPVSVTSYTEYFDAFASVSLANPDNASITSIDYMDPDGSLQTLGAIYSLRDGVLVLNDDEEWPSKDGEVTVSYDAGWSVVPEAIKQAGYFYAASINDARTIQGMDPIRLREIISLMVAGYRRIGL